LGAPLRFLPVLRVRLPHRLAGRNEMDLAAGTNTVRFAGFLLLSARA
jgi:hypothetical protein